MSAMKDPLEVSFVDRTREDPAPAAGAVGASGKSVRLEFPAAITAILQGFDDDDRVLIRFPGPPDEVVAARSVIGLSPSHVGASLVVAFEHGDRHRPIVLGVLQERVLAADALKGQAELAWREDGEEHVVLSAKRQITLRCGEASITLTHAGKVIIKGAHVVSRSTGHNKIKGAVVDIN